MPRPTKTQLRADAKSAYRELLEQMRLFLPSREFKALAAVYDIGRVGGPFVSGYSGTARWLDVDLGEVDQLVRSARERITKHVQFQELIEKLLMAMHALEEAERKEEEGSNHGEQRKAS